MTLPERLRTYGLIWQFRTNLLPYYHCEICNNRIGSNEGYRAAFTNAAGHNESMIACISCVLKHCKEELNLYLIKEGLCT